MPWLDEPESGLTDPRTCIRYQPEIGQKELGKFRNASKELCNCLAFCGQRAFRSCEACEPFDRHIRHVQGVDYATAFESGEEKANELS
jgi:hypothetical protein